MHSKYYIYFWNTLGNASPHPIKNIMQTEQVCNYTRPEVIEKPPVGRAFH